MNRPRCELLPIPATRSAPAGAMSRRDLLARTATGFGALALAALLEEQKAQATPRLEAAGSGRSGIQNPLAAAAPHFAPRARRMIFLFMHGGPSHVDTFDYKPLLVRDDGKPMPFSKPRVQFAQTGNLLKSPWEFHQYGQSGLWISDLFPQVARHADKLCVINSMHTDNVVHGNAVLQLHTGSSVFIRPSLGSWLTYGLGTENDNLPGFLTISPCYAHGGVTNWGSAFLPAAHQGTPIGSDRVPVKDSSIKYIRNEHLSPAVQRAQLDLMRELNDEHLSRSVGGSTLEGRIASFELAFRMQTEAPELLEISRESPETLDRYGLNDPATADFGQQCLLARRFSERGVRFVQLSHSYKWDQHGNLKADHEKNAREVDRPIAALLEDLEARGLLDETLVLWGGEFGRTPTAQGTDGRDHNPYGYTMWLAGGGVRGGCTYGATDEYGYYAVQDRVHIPDLHATLLHLMGLDHERLVFSLNGRDFRLTDVSGRGDSRDPDLVVLDVPLPAAGASQDSVTGNRLRGCGS